ncbi:hypothetical protein [Streptomyces sp. NBC_01304]|uniref:hypothetical protein n=1 Tax=Streptomyces sp. NBC_01304 TaxID=2903818 RepID=UPI002E12977B|nr:hypothetical protein OG430_44925 [Streptomyces sp. NBC_01304]
MAPHMAIEAGSDTDHLLRCLISLDTQHHRHSTGTMLTTYVLDWQPAPGFTAGGILTSRPHPESLHLTSLEELDWYTEHVIAPDLPHTQLQPFDTYAGAPDYRVGAVVVAEFEDGDMFALDNADAGFRQLFAVDFTGTITTVLHTSGSLEPRWAVQPPGGKLKGDSAAGVDYATLGPQVTALALGHIHGIGRETH